MIENPPLAGLRILAVEQYGAGPYGSMHLADLGAEVIKIESPPGGDVSRGTGPYFLGEGDSLFFQTFNLIGRISVLKNVEVPMMLSGVARERRRSRALELLEAVGMAHRSDFSPSNISGGREAEGGHSQSPGQ